MVIKRPTAALLIALLLAGLLYLSGCVLRALPLQPADPRTPSPLATWPWSKARKDSPHPGITHWLDRSGPDGTVLDLFDFDFGANPRLRLELYDQDEDDTKPFDDRVDFWPRGVGQAVRHLNETGRGRVVAAWNGLFFGYADDGAQTIAHHVAPVVLNGHVHYNVGNHRWTFGVQYPSVRPASTGGAAPEKPANPVFKVIHLPDRATLQREFTFAAGGAQCLIHDGVPLKLQPFPQPGQPPLHGPVPSTPAEAGHIPIIDHIKTSRTSIAWSRDNHHLYLLVVKQTHPEPASGEAPSTGGWTLADEQQFWKAFGAWNAINSDGGEVTQMTYLRPDGQYELIPPRWSSPANRLLFNSDFTGAPEGGTLMYFYVRDGG